VRVRGEEALPVFKGSGDITSLSDADGYLEIPVGVAHLDEGAEVVVTLF
jgi:molybdopterin biosynthesis enzyme